MKLFLNLKKRAFGTTFLPLKMVFALIPSIIFNILFVSIAIFIWLKADFSKGFIFFSPYFVRVLSFTFIQGFWGAFLSVLVALFLVPTTQKLPHFFWGKSVRYLLSIPFFLPSIVGCLALIGLFGQSGFFSSICAYLGLPYTSFLYGIYGILLCHVFYYTPFALQVFDKCLLFLPGEAKRLGASLGMGPFSQFRFLYYPLLKEEIPPLFSLVFMYCLRSFTAVLIFGGTPQNTTLEVEIYHALNFDLDWNVAAQLCFAQLSLNIFISYFSKKPKRSPSPPLVSGFQSPLFEKLNYADAFSFSFIFVLFFLSLFSVFSTGFSGLSSICFEQKMLESILNSLIMGFLSFIFSMLFVIPLVYTTYKLRFLKWEKISFFVGELPSKLSLIFSPTLIAFLFYFLSGPFFETKEGFLLTISLINGLCLTPTLYLIFLSSYCFQRERYDPVCSALNLSGLWRLVHIDFEDLKKPLGYAWAMCQIFSVGDSRIIFLFNKGYFSSLTIFLYDKMRSYEFSKAAAVGLFIVLLSGFILWASEKIFGKYER